MIYPSPFSSTMTITQEQYNQLDDLKIDSIWFNDKNGTLQIQSFYSEFSNTISFIEDKMIDNDIDIPEFIQYLKNKTIDLSPIEHYRDIIHTYETNISII